MKKSLQCYFLLKFVLITCVCADFRGPVPIQDDVLSYHDLIYPSRLNQLWAPVHSILTLNGNGTILAVVTMVVMSTLALMLMYLFPASKSDQGQIHEAVRIRFRGNSVSDSGMETFFSVLKNCWKKGLPILLTHFPPGVIGMLLIMAGIEQNPGPIPRESPELEETIHHPLQGNEDLEDLPEGFHQLQAVETGYTREKPPGKPFTLRPVRPSELSPGDHLLYLVSRKPYSPCFQSALVCDVSGGDILVIENTTSGVEKHWYRMTESTKLYLIQYTFCRFSSDEAISRAKWRRLLGEKCYCPLYNSSHQFVTWTKTGKQYSLSEIVDDLNAIQEEENDDSTMVASGPVEMTAMEHQSADVNRTGQVYPDNNISAPPSQTTSAGTPQQSADEEEGELLKPVLTKVTVESLEDLTPGVHVWYRKERHVLVKSVDNQKRQFTGYTCEDKKIILKKYKWDLPGRTFRIDYVHSNLKPATVSLQEAHDQCTKDGSQLWLGGDDGFVTKMKLGFKYTLDTQCFFSEKKGPFSCTKVSMDTVVTVGDHLLVKDSQEKCHSVLVYDCVDHDILRSIPDLGEKERKQGYFRLGEQKEVIRINYRESFPPNDVKTRAFSKEGYKVLKESKGCSEKFVSWAKVGEKLMLDVPGLLAEPQVIQVQPQEYEKVHTVHEIKVEEEPQVIQVQPQEYEKVHTVHEIKVEEEPQVIQVQPQEYEKVHTVHEIKVGDHLIRNDHTHKFHSLITDECNTEPPHIFMAVYCLRTYIKETKIIINPNGQEVYRIVYPESFTADIAVKRAKKYLDTRDFSLHARMSFVTWAKTGSHKGVDIAFLHNKALPIGKSQIRSITQLNPGDYFVCSEGTSHYHHYLLTEVCSPTSFKAFESWRGRIAEVSKTLQSNSTCYRIDYDDNICLAPENAIHKAEQLRGRRIYFKQNLARRSFVHYIKTTERAEISVDCLHQEGPEREAVWSAKDLSCGDHIIRPIRGKGGKIGEHHMLVTAKPTDERKCMVIHFNVSKTLQGKVEEQCIDLFEAGEVYRLKYADRIHPEDGIKLLQRNHKKDEYNLLVHNCEHLITLATVGTPLSKQVSDGTNKLVHGFQKIGKAAAVLVVQGSSLKGAPKTVFRAGVFEKAGIELTTIISASTVRVLGDAGGATALASVPIDGAIMSWNIYKLYRKRQFEHITEVEFKRGVVKEHFIAINSTIFSTVGAIAGTFIPVPFVGTALGAAAGSVVGEVVGRGECYFAFKIADKYFPKRPVNMPHITVYSYS